MRRDKTYFNIYIYIHNLNCNSSWAIYIVKCIKCNLQYVGKSETNLNIRMNNHRSHIKSGINSCELSEHFLQNKTSHTFEKDTSITVIEQLRKQTMTTEQKKQLLRAREEFWQKQLGSIQPTGLNKRIG